MSISAGAIAITGHTWCMVSISPSLPCRRSIETPVQNSKFKSLIRKVNIYPPYLGMGIRVASTNEDFTRFDVELRPKWYTRNLFGTHFGGSLYAMADPFFVFIVMMNFGQRYIVWDKSAAIEFLRPAKGTIRATFEISQDELARMRAQVDELGKNTYHFEVDLVDEANNVVARVAKEVYVRKKAPRDG